jgi:hypothetical protein
MGAEYGAGRALTRRLAPKAEALPVAARAGLMGTPGPDVAVRGWQDSQILLGAQASEESQGLHGELAVLQGCRHVCGGVPAMARKGPQRCGRGPSRGLQKVPGSPDLGVRLARELTQLPPPASI